MKNEQAKINECLNRVDMADYSDKLIGRLSGGQQQRVFIARALASNPDFLILDEPTVGVDARSVRHITELIKELHENGMTIIMTNHDTHSLVALADKLLILEEDGKAHIIEKKNFKNHFQGH